MYHITLDQTPRQELQKRTHQRELAPRTRDRLEMVRLSDAGWSIPKIAIHLQSHEHTVRTWIKKYLSNAGDLHKGFDDKGFDDKGFDALEDQPHRGRPSAISPQILAQVHQWIETGEHTWNAPQVAGQVAQTFGIHRSAPQWRRLLGREGLTYKRTRRTLKHKQKSELVAKKRADLETLQKGGTLDSLMSASKMKRGSR